MPHSHMDDWLDGERARRRGRELNTLPVHQMRGVPRGREGQSPERIFSDGQRSGRHR